MDEPHAMVLSTVRPDGTPSLRTVLLRGIDERGLTFFTNYESAKAAAIEAQPVVECLFLWLPVHRSEEHTSELQSLMRISYAVFCLKKKKAQYHTATSHQNLSKDTSNP